MLGRFRLLVRFVVAWADVGVGVAKFHLLIVLGMRVLFAVYVYILGGFLVVLVCFV